MMGEQLAIDVPGERRNQRPANFAVTTTSRRHGTFECDWEGTAFLRASQFFYGTAHTKPIGPGETVTIIDRTTGVTYRIEATHPPDEQEMSER